MRHLKLNFRLFASFPIGFTCRQFEELGRFDTEYGGQLPHDLQARIERAFFELTQIASAHFSFVREIVLRKPLCVSQSAKVCCKHLSQIHARSECICSKYAPRYIEQNIDRA